MQTHKIEPPTDKMIAEVSQICQMAEEIESLQSQNLLLVERVKELSEALEWLEDRVYDGRGMVEIGLTEDGDLGIFIHQKDMAIASGTTILEVLKDAALKGDSLKEKE